MNSAFEFKVDYDPNSITKLNDKLLIGDAIILNRSGLSKKQERVYERNAKRWMMLKNVPSPILHQIGYGGYFFYILEKPD